MDQINEDRLREIETAFTTVRDNLGGLVALINHFMEVGLGALPKVEAGNVKDSRPNDVMIWVMRSAIQEVVGMTESFRQRIIQIYAESTGPPPGEIVE